MAKQQAESTKENKANATAKKPAGDGAASTGEKGNGAPRPRKFNYGIVGENKVGVIALKAGEDGPVLKAGEAEGYAMAAKGCTVEAFLADSTRSILRRLSRKGLVTITGTDGTVYPITYVAPEKPVKAVKEAAPEAGVTAAA